MNLLTVIPLSRLHCILERRTHATQNDTFYKEIIFYFFHENFSLTNMLCFSLGLLILVLVHTSLPFNFQSAPVTHCLRVFDESEVANRYSLKTLQSNQSIFSLLDQCTSNYCKKVVRVCLDGELPLERLSYQWNCGMNGLFLLSSLVSVVLLILSNYETIYFLAKKIKVKIIHYTYLQDLLRDNKDGCWKTRRMKLIREVDNGVLNRRGNAMFLSFSLPLSVTLSLSFSLFTSLCCFLCLCLFLALSIYLSLLLFLLLSLSLCLSVSLSLYFFKILS